jgi:hypothetical protein
MFRSIKCGQAGVAVSAHREFEDRDPAARFQRLLALAQNLHAALIVPVMQDELQQIEVSGRNRLEEVAADNLGALGEAVSRDVRLGVLCDYSAPPVDARTQLI